MGREIKRVAIDFDWPTNETWQGYLMPDELDALKCQECDGSGYSRHANYLHSLWYGYVPFAPEDNGSTPLTPDTPAVRAFAERNVARSPAFYGVIGGDDEWVIRREAKRLADMWNSQWNHHLNADDVAALVEAGRLWDLTHTWDKENKWQPKDPPVTPTPEQVNKWAIGSLGHDAINASVCIRARCEREGQPVECSTCDGSGQAWRDDAHKAAHEAWEETEPPEGDGWQLWETVSEGSPISPVFPDAEGLIAWMQTSDAEWGASGPWSEETARTFVLGSGWAPTFVGSPAGLVDGVTAMAKVSD